MTSIKLVVWGIIGVVFLYLIIKRIKDKKAETFEDRDN